MTSGRLRINVAAATDPGLKRHHNEDNYAVWSPSDGRPHAAEHLLVLCDGMGGSNAGEVASSMAVEALVRAFGDSGDNDAGVSLGRAIETANREVWEHTRSRPELEGMGTTCTALAVRGDEVTVGHVGDSRAYLIRSGRANQLTQDHSLVAQLVQSGQLTPEAARRDSRRNVVTRSVGIGPDVEVDIVKPDEHLMPGDTLLVCSDGLHGQVTEYELAELGANDSLDRACRDLIALANQRGGPDNITVLLLRREAESERVARPPRRAAAPAARAGSRRGAAKAAPVTGRRRTLQMLVAVLIVLLLVVCGLAWVVFGMMRSDRTSHTSVRMRAGDTAWA